MKDWSTVKGGFGKVRSFTEKVSPPVPSDEFDNLKGEILKRCDKMDQFLDGQITGDGSVSLPEAAPE